MRKVTYVRLHDLKVIMPGLGNATTEFPSSKKVLPDLQMTYDGAIVEISFGGNSYGIPLANIQCIRFAPEAPKTTK
jgi:hypothetical protein